MFCVKEADEHFESLQELSGLPHVPPSSLCLLAHNYSSKQLLNTEQSQKVSGPEKATVTTHDAHCTDVTHTETCGGKLTTHHLRVHRLGSVRAELDLLREVELNQERNRSFVEIHSCNDQSCSPSLLAPESRTSPVQFDLEVKVHPVLLSKLQAIFYFFRSPSD